MSEGNASIRILFCSNSISTYYRRHFRRRCQRARGCDVILELAPETTPLVAHVLRYSSWYVTLGPLFEGKWQVSADALFSSHIR